MMSAFAAVTMIVGCSDDSKSPTQPPPAHQASVITATGAITPEVAQFRTLIGDPANGATPGQQAAGRREVNWDGAGARPFNNRNDFPADFFNGVGLIYVGAAFRNDSSLFADINPTYAAEFKPFSSKVLFSAIGTNVIEAKFRVAGAATPAAVSGFGAVFTDVDLAHASSIELFDKDGASLGRYEAPVRSDADGLSFVGVKYEAAIVTRVLITCGNAALAAGVNDVTSGGTKDLVVIDNVIYGEPKAF